MGHRFTPEKPIEKFICGGIKCTPESDFLSLYRQLGDDAAWEHAQSNQVDSIIGKRLLEKLGPTNTPTRWQNRYIEIKERIGSYMVELDRVAELLDKAGIPLVALKNSGIARGLYTDTGLMPMGDVDTMVRRSDFKAAHQVLLQAGYQIAAPNKLEKADVNLGYLKGSSEYEIELPTGQNLWFELQWRPVEGRFLRPDQEPKADDLMERSLEVSGSKVRILSPEDNLLQVALHTAKHSYVRAPGFRLHLDVERIVHTQDIDWDLFTHRVLKHQVRTPVYFSLLMPKMLFNTPVPADVLAAIAPAQWKEKSLTHWIHHAGIYNPDESKFGKTEFIAFTAFLYDSLGGFTRGVFPESEWMKERYQLKSNVQVPFYYGKRIYDLLARRMAT